MISENLIDSKKFQAKVLFVIYCGVILMKDSVLMWVLEVQDGPLDRYIFHDSGQFNEIQSHKRSEEDNQSTSVDEWWVPKYPW